jgi:hypothetical protein
MSPGHATIPKDCCQNASKLYSEKRLIYFVVLDEADGDVRGLIVSGAGR